MCKTCEQAAEKLRKTSANEHNFYPARNVSRIKAVRKLALFRNKSHTFSQALPTGFFGNLYLLKSQLSTSSTGLINTITNR